MFERIEDRASPTTNQSAQRTLQDDAITSMQHAEKNPLANSSPEKPKADEIQLFTDLYKKKNLELDPIKTGEGPLQSLEQMAAEGKLSMSHEQMLDEAKRIKDRETRAGHIDFKPGDHIKLWSEQEIDQMAQHLAELPKGIDVSNHQGTINWQKVKDSGVQFAYMKATEGDFYTDPYFAGNRKAAQDAGLRVGYYHYFHPEQSIEKQVKLFTDTIGKAEPDSLRLEIDAEDPSLWRQFTPEQRVQKIEDFCQGVKKALGVTPELIIYCNPSFADDLINNSPALQKYPLFIANYGVDKPTVPDPWSKWDFWQYSETGRVPGINGNVDMDLFNGSADELSKYPFNSLNKSKDASLASEPK